MSLNGSKERSLTLLQVTVTRNLSEQDLKLTPGRIIRITIPFVDLVVDDYGWSWRSRLRRRRPGLGVWLDRDTGNDLRPRYHGDAVALDPDYKRSWQ